MNGELDSLGLPTHIDTTAPEVDGKDQQNDIHVNLKETPQETDKVRITFRSGIVITLDELWHNQMIVMSIKTTKGAATFAVYDPSQTGFNALKVKTPVDIL